MSSGNAGWRSSEVNDSAALPPGTNVDYRTANYVPAGDSTSSGGYGSAQNPYSHKAQRGHIDSTNSTSETGLIDQSTTGGPISQEIEDAKQGKDGEGRRKFQHEAQRDFAQGSQGLNPYGKNPDSREQVGDMLADKYTDARGKQFESGAAASLENDGGMI